MRRSKRNNWSGLGQDRVVDLESKIGVRNVKFHGELRKKKTAQ